MEVEVVVVVGAAEAAGVVAPASRAARERVERERRVRWTRGRCIVDWLSLAV